MCACGATVGVPTLRQLRQLPRADEVGATPSRSWGARQGVMAVCVILAVVCLLVAAASRYSQPELPTFDATAHRSAVERGLAGLTPTGAWRLWVDTYEPLAARGLSEFKPPGVVQIERQIAWHRLLQIGMTAAAATALAVAAGLAVAGGRGR